jgi:hypothetical protein
MTLSKRQRPTLEDPCDANQTTTPHTCGLSCLAIQKNTPHTCDVFHAPCSTPAKTTPRTQHMVYGTPPQTRAQVQHWQKNAASRCPQPTKPTRSFAQVRGLCCCNRQLRAPNPRLSPSPHCLLTALSRPSHCCCGTKPQLLAPQCCRC